MASVGQQRGEYMRTIGGLSEVGSHVLQVGV